MRLEETEPASPEAENMLPMINIVFLLLIFFLIVGSIQISAPFSLEPLRGRGLSTSAQPLVLFISSENKFSINQHIYSLGEIRSHLKKQVDQIGRLPAIELRADRASNTRDVIRFLHILELLGAEEITLAVME